MPRDTISSVFFFLGICVLVGSCIKRPRLCSIAPIRIGSVDSVCVSVFRQVRDYPKLKFSYPYRDDGKCDILRVNYDNAVLFDFPAGQIVTINDIQDKALERYLLDVGISKEELITQVSIGIKVMQESGIHAVVDDDSTLRVTTRYVDSSYHTLQSRHSFYRELLVEHQDSVLLYPKHFVIVFVKFKSKPSSKRLDDFNKVHYLWKIDSLMYYYRTYR